MLKIKKGRLLKIVFSKRKVVKFLKGKVENFDSEINSKRLLTLCSHLWRLYSSRAYDSKKA